MIYKGGIDTRIVCRLFFLLSLVLLSGCLSVQAIDQFDIQVGHPYTKLNGNGTDRVNIMIYFYGADLEDDVHMASADIAEIMENELSGNVRVFIETDGACNWDQSVLKISNEYVQRFMIDGNGARLIEKNLGPVKFNTKENLEWFISQTAKKYPAERNILILWGHGNDGRLWDDKISIQDMDEIFTNAGVKFELIGFDACYMANSSVMEIISKHADYMIASSTEVLLSGWNYENWISILTQDPSVASEVYISQIIQDFTLEQQETGELHNLNAFDLSRLTLMSF